jgi:hypothetical protein
MPHVIFAIVLAGCDDPVAREPPKMPAIAEFGRYTIVPASNNPVLASGTSYLFAWKLDTKTGDIEVCTYDPGGWINAATKMPANQSLTCIAKD